MRFIYIHIISKISKFSKTIFTDPLSQIKIKETSTYNDAQQRSDDCVVTTLICKI